MEKIIQHKKYIERVNEVKSYLARLVLHLEPPLFYTS